MLFSKPRLGIYVRKSQVQRWPYEVKVSRGPALTLTGVRVDAGRDAANLESRDARPSPTELSTWDGCNHNGINCVTKHVMVPVSVQKTLLRRKTLLER